ncbi:Ribonuclease H1 [Gaertneriomyces sp. JEL0708]|nr:Ribonuclease H1 [Gaertneriomyces sp. JEL0708]
MTLASGRDECKRQVDAFPGAKHKKFQSLSEAEAWIHAGTSVRRPAKPALSATGAVMANALRPEHPSASLLSSSGAPSLNPDIEDDEFGIEDFQTDEDLEVYLNAVDQAEQAVFFKRCHEGKNLPVIEVYTDGACANNGKGARARAGYGVWYGHNDPRNISAPLPGPLQTNNRAEMTAVIKALQNVPKFMHVIIHSDSQYMKNGIEKWIEGWKRTGWISKSSGKPVLNKDLWVELDKLRDEYDGAIEFRYVKGHAGIAGNEGADKLAVAGAQMTRS